MAQIKGIASIRNRVVKEKVHTPEWGDEGDYVFARGLSGREVEKWQQSLMQQSKGESPKVTLERMRGSNARLVILGACDENGEPIFEGSDQSALMDNDNAALVRVAEAIQKLSGIGTDEAELVEEFLGNSETDQERSSSSGSQSTSAGLSMNS